MNNRFLNTRVNDHINPMKQVLTGYHFKKGN